MATVSGLTSHFLQAKEGFTTTTSGSVSSGATTVGLNSTSGYSNGEIVALVIDPADATKKQVFVGEVSGTNIINVIWTEGTNQSHVAGATVADYVTATHYEALIKGLLVSHDQDGTLKAGAVDNAAALASDVVTTAKILDGNVTTAKILDSNVTPAKLLAGTGTTWAWTTYTPTYTNVSGGTTNYAKYIQIGKTVHVRVKYTLAGAGISGAITISLPVAAHADYVSASVEPFNGSAVFRKTPATAASFTGVVRWASSTTVVLRVLDASGTSLQEVSTSSTLPHTWANTDFFAAAFSYEAA